MSDLVKLILCYSFWKDNKYKILKEMFPTSLYDLYDLVSITHDKLERDLSIDEVKALYKVHYPTTTTAKLDLVFQVLDTLPEIEKDVAQEVLEKAWIIELGRQITQIGTDIVQGKTTSLEKAKALVSKIEQGELSTRDELVPVSSELEDILDAINVTTRWAFNIEPLRIVASGIGPNTFSIVFARVEAGKTAFWISICASPGGFASSGAIIHAYCNEESAQRTQGRAIMSYTGMPLLEILNNKERARDTYNEVRNNLKFFECKGMDIGQIDQHVSKHRPDIIVIDQLDKLSINGTYARRDEMLGALYQSARDIGAKYNCAVIAISQANADSEGKNFMSSANLADSRTSKSAEGDLVIGIGKGIQHTDNQRMLNMIKNKITGRHEDVICMIRPEISRYVA